MWPTQSTRISLSFFIFYSSSLFNLSLSFFIFYSSSLFNLSLSLLPVLGQTKGVPEPFIWP
jgi:hypothetical protein